MMMFGEKPRDAQGLGMTSQRARDRLVERLRGDGIRDLRVLEAIKTVPRHLYVDEGLASRAYDDAALPIGLGQTISQPWVVARMSEALIEHGVPNKVLEVGTGSGYQAAVLSALVPNVYTVERIQKLLLTARARFRKMGARNIRARHDDGRLGWPEEAPFDAILVTAAGETIADTLVDQLAPGGTLVAPVGPQNGTQVLVRLRRTVDGITRETLGNVAFVPLLGGLA